MKRESPVRQDTWAQSRWTQFANDIGMRRPAGWPFCWAAYWAAHCFRLPELLPIIAWLIRRGRAARRPLSNVPPTRFRAAGRIVARGFTFVPLQRLLEAR